MKNYEEIFLQLKKEVSEKLDFYVDERTNMGVCTLPFKDSVGDYLVVRINKNEGYLILDDAGTVENNVFVMSQTIGGVRANRLINSLVRSFDARLNREEGLVELVCSDDEIIAKIFHFAKLVITADTMLVEIGKEEKEQVRPYRRSLGPRASHKMRTSLRPLIDVKKVKHRVTVGGLTVPDWLVDFAYEPKIERLVMSVDLVVLISVDLAVLDPIMKATYAYSRAMDIKAAHDRYDIRIAYDTHGQNSAAASGANFLKEHQIHDRTYRAIDMSKREDLEELVRTINLEAGMPLA